MTTNKSNPYELTTPMNKKLFQSFLADELTVKEAKALNEDITKRFYYIVHKIAEITGRKVDWFDYDNEGGEYSPGVFDTSRYDSEVGYRGDFSVSKSGNKERFEDYDSVFPTNWFYTNFENRLLIEKEEFFQELQKEEDQKKENKLKVKEELQTFHDSIMKKLTMEELAYISFLPIEEVRKNKKNANKEVTVDIAKFIKEMKNQGVVVSEQYGEYRKGKKKAQEFHVWVLKNMEKIRNIAKLKAAEVWPLSIENSNKFKSPKK